MRRLAALVTVALLGVFATSLAPATARVARHGVRVSSHYWARRAATRLPASVTNLHVTGRTQTSVSVAWDPAARATGYRLYQDNVAVGTTTATSHTFAGLACEPFPGGASYDFGVAAYNSRGTSARATVTESTLPCSTGDTTPPDTTITSGPPDGTTSTDASFTFTGSDDVGVTGFDCSIDGAAFSSCASPKDYSGLATGSHTFRVRARDAAGHVDPTPASYPWSISGAPPPPGSANLWVRTAGGSCTRHAAAGAEVAAEDCGSFDAAYRAAQPGDVVLIRGGTYPGQTINVDSTKINASSDVTMQVVAGETATLTGDLRTFASHLLIEGQSASERNLRMPFHTLDIESQDGANRTNHTTVRYVAAANFWIKPVTFVTVDQSDFGPSVACNANYPSAQTENQITSQGTNYYPDHVTISNNLIHDMNTDDPNACHIGGLILQSFTSLAITGNKFYRDTIYDIESDEFTGTQPVSPMLIENNWFGPPVGTNTHSGGSDPNYGVSFEADVQVKWNGHAASDWLVRYNSFANGFSPEWNNAPAPSYTNFRVVGNVGGTLAGGPQGWQACAAAGKPGVIYSRNVFLGLYNGSLPGSNPACTTDGVNLGAQAYSGNEYDLSRLPYASASTLSPDYHLKGAAGSTPADNLVAETGADYALGSDVDGQARSAPRDAGSDER